MQSLMLGLLAALLWGLHDFTLRRIAAKADAAALYLLVLVVGAAFLLPMAILYGGMRELSSGVLGFSALTGVVYALGVYALYQAFGIGPVRVVAPICGAFPLLSVSFAMAQGQAVGAWVWVACLAVLLGIGVMAQGEGGAAKGSRLAAIGWSCLAALGFAVSFAMMHRTISHSGDAQMLLSLVVRCAGFLTILAVVLVQRIDLKPALSIWPTLVLMGALDVGGMVAVAMAGNFARPEFASVTSSCFGLVTILLAWRFLREPLTPLQAMGAVVVFCGVAVLGFV